MQHPNNLFQGKLVPQGLEIREMLTCALVPLRAHVKEFNIEIFFLVLV
jgi:hypothetical protein